MLNPPFKSGDKVVCIENAFEDRRRQNHNVPKKDNTYTIRACIYFKRPHYTGYAVLLAEVRNAPRHYQGGYYEEICWREMYFRKLDDLLDTWNLPEWMFVENPVEELN